MEHKLKILPEYFEAVACGDKNFELRKDDREFSVGDMVCLEEWSPAEKKYTGRCVTRSITYILRNALEYGLADGFCIISIA